jgi:fatty acid desaturase
MALIRSNRLPANTIALAAHVAILCCGIWGMLAFGLAAERTDHGPRMVLIAMGMILVSLLTATRIRALGNIMHECTHGHFFESRNANNRLGQVIGIVLLQSYTRYAQDHKTHHAHLAEVNLDLDLARYNGAHRSMGVPYNFWKQLRCALNWQCLRAGFTIRVWEEIDSRTANLARIVWLLTLVTLVTVFVPGIAAAGMLLSFFLFYPVLCVWSDLADHFILPSVVGEFSEPGETEETGETITESTPVSLSRNHIFSSSLLNLVLLPRNDGFHLVHHLFPSAPITTYPAKHDLLLQRWPKYSELSHHLSLEFKPKG